MGWSSAGSTIFDPVARALISAGASDELKHETLAALIDALRDGDWDTEDESLEEFRVDRVIVEVFRQKGVTMTCDAGRGTPGVSPCLRKLGHKGDHVDEHDNSWTQATQDVPA